MKFNRIIIIFFLILFAQVIYATEFNIDIKSSIQDTVKTCKDCHSDLVGKRYIHAPLEDACDNCHSSNKNPHPDSNAKGFNLADDVPTLCFYCHEEYTQKNIHAPAEAGECSMCHNSHSSDNPKLLNDPRVDKLCYECHDMEIGERDRVHVPVEEGTCEVCHDSHQSNNRSFLKAAGPELCFTCHESVKEETQKRSVHAPLEDDCSNCHKSHKSSERGLLTEAMPTLCFSCHEEYTKKNIHAPVEAGECAACHSSHGTDNIKLLLASSTDKLCFECHDLEIPTTDIVHVPVEEGACEECHDSHQADNRSFLKLSGSQLCFTCHDTEKEESLLRRVHAPFEDDCANCHQSHSAPEKGLISEKTPALCYNCHGDVQEIVETAKFAHKPMNDEKSCNNCHSTHASKENGILLEAEKELCLTCHARTYTSESGKTENIKQKLKAGNSIHAPVEDGCVICHKPHASDHTAILNNTFPSGTYSEAKEENFALCFECHDSGLLLNEKTTDVTNFRDGDINMHYLHIKGEKGRSCNTCHDSHATKNKFLIKDKVLFGKWEMDMNFLVKENGGSCATGCHAEEEYDRSTESILSEENAQNKVTERAAPINRYQNFTEHVQDIDSSVIKYNIMRDKRIAEAARRDSIEQARLALLADSVMLKEDSLIVQETPIVTKLAEVEELIEKEESEAEDTDNLLIKEEEKPDIAVEPVSIEKKIEIIEFQAVLFEFTEATLSDAAKETILLLAEYLRRNAELKIELHGHTDNVGNPDFNMDLSISRANNVKTLLMKSGIDSNRITVKGFAGEKPLISNNTEIQRAQNRRVEFVIK